LVNNSLILAKGRSARLSRRRALGLSALARKTCRSRARARLLGGKLTSKNGGNARFLPCYFPRLANLTSETSSQLTPHSLETFPTEMKAVAEAGHEIGIHGYSHENPIAMTREQEMAVLDKCIDLVTELSGKRPTGYVAPWWEFSTVTNELLLERGIKYDHSLMHHDHQPYYVRVGDSWTKIDYWCFASRRPRR